MHVSKIPILVSPCLGGGGEVEAGEQVVIIGEVVMNFINNSQYIFFVSHMTKFPIIPIDSYVMYLNMENEI